jgi:DNA-binding CsgD family transcriptional regulator
VASPAGDLSQRELSVLRLVAAGQTDKEVAAALGLRVRTVNAHVARIRRKLGVSSRAAAAAELIRRGQT